MEPSTGDELVLHLESQLPESLPPGSVTSVPLMGWCWHPVGRVEGLTVSCGADSVEARDLGMPRPDVGAATEPRNENAFRSGFWVTVPVTVPDRADQVEIRFEATLEGGGQCDAGPIRIPVRPPQPPAGVAPARIAICMATFGPDPGLFRIQIDSIRSQTAEDWICLISDDCSSPESLAMIRRETEADPRFLVSASTERLGFYRNFERCLGLVPDGVELIALSDQDDRWYPEKLEVLGQAIGSSGLVYSDQRLTDESGAVLAETLWKGRRNNHRNLTSMLVANTVTGAASMFRRELLDRLLPFPEVPGWQFHDQWLGITALANGDVAYVDRPLYDYVQHRGAILGQLASGAGSSRSVSGRFREWLRPWKSVSGDWRASYFFDVRRVRAQAETVLLRGGSGISPSKRRVLERFANAENSISALLRLWLRPLRSLIGLSETLGTESDLVRGLLWRRQVRLRNRRGSSRQTLDASLPPGGPADYGSGRLKRWRAG